MSGRGVVGMDRDVFEHELLKGEPYTKVQAWLWLVAEAAWKERRARPAGYWIELKRGELAHSLSHMARIWQWSVKRVRWFLEKLAEDGMIRSRPGMRSDHGMGVNVLTICNYDEYQVVALPKGKAGAHEGQQPERRIDRGSDAHAEKLQPTGISPEAFTLADDFLVAIGIDPKNPEFFGMAGAPYAVQMWLTRGYERVLILATAADKAARYGPNKPLNFYTKCFETAHSARPVPGQRAFPLLQEVTHGQTTQRTPAGAGPATTWQGSRDAFRVARAEFKAGLAAANAAPGRDDDSGGPVIRPAAAAGCG